MVLKEVMERLNYIEETHNLFVRISKMYEAGNKDGVVIELVKEYRDRTGVDLSVYL